MRAIDADWCRKQIRVLRDEFNGYTKHEESIRGGIRKVARIIEGAPTLDVAPVVRCKDCVYSKPMPDRGVPKFGADALNCTACRGDDGYGFYGISVVWADDYCSNGAKMDGDGA